MTSIVELSPDQARRVLLRAQGLLGAQARRGGVPGMLRRLGAVQLDTISVLARSHELVAYARLGPVGRDRVERAYWSRPGRPATAFEYWSHAACVLPIEQWPLFAFRRRAIRARGRRWHPISDRAVKEVLVRLRAEGPMTATQLGGAKAGGVWWDWSETKVAVEWLLDIGEVACVRREGWRRVYDITERAVPAELLAAEPSDEECLAGLAAIAAGALGIAGRSDLVDFHRFRREHTALLDRAAEAAGLVPVAVAGWRGPLWADPAALETVPAGRHRTTLLSPFDSLIWDRRRTERVFDFDHRLEAYVPAAKRVHGYFTMPLLAGGRLVGRVDPARTGTTLVARRLSLTGPRAVEPMATALGEAAQWVGCDDVRLDRVAPAELAAPLAAALRRA